jgi:hypothetical protein
MGPKVSGRMLPIRTAVLVVHGMGIQRPLETVRGVIKAVWLSGHSDDANNKVWFHPERSGIDIDLAVITTNWVPGVTPNRSIDFHELYWSHLMSETPAIAVLLWLFELARKGPRLKPNMALVWGAAALFLVLMILSIAMIALKLIERLAEVHGQDDSILFAPVLMFAIFGVGSCFIFAWFRAWSLAAGAAIFGVALLLFYFFAKEQPVIWATWFLPSLVALLATMVLMGGWGIIVFVVAYILSCGYEYLVHVRTSVGWTVSPWDLIPWKMDSPWCVVAACVILVTYLIVSVVFLQPYLGDAARYFRNAPSNVAVRREIRHQAVSTLENLHLSGRYDRIVIVAHSLGSAIAYDMLRAYFARVARYLPTTGDGLDAKIAAAEAEIDTFNAASKQTKAAVPDPTAMRSLGRQIIAQISAIVQAERAAAKAAMPPDAVPVAADEIIPTRQRAWLVSDFVTLGSPLTHAHYLMCQGETEAELAADFARRVDEREFPVCPPERVAGAGGDAPLTYVRTGDANGPRSFHNGALFGLTRWTNLFFPVSELFNGDAIGGPLTDVFGKGVVDVPLAADSPRGSGFDAHIRYWYVPDKDPISGHIRQLRKAINLAEV